MFAVDGSGLFSRPGPRVVDGIEVLAELIDPAAFDGMSPPGHVGPHRLTAMLRRRPRHRSAPASTACGAARRWTTRGAGRPRGLGAAVLDLPGQGGHEPVPAGPAAVRDRGARGVGIGRRLDRRRAGDGRSPATPATAHRHPPRRRRRAATLPAPAPHDLPRRLVPAPRRVRARGPARHGVGRRAGRRHALARRPAAQRADRGAGRGHRASSRRWSRTRASCMSRTPTAPRSIARATGWSPTACARISTSRTRGSSRRGRASPARTGCSPRSCSVACGAPASRPPRSSLLARLRPGGRLASIELLPDPAGGPPSTIPWTWHDPDVVEASLRRAGFRRARAHRRPGASSGSSRRRPADPRTPRPRGRSPHGPVLSSGAMSPLANRTIATVGSGVMAEAMIAGLLRGNLVDAVPARGQPPAAGATGGARDAPTASGPSRRTSRRSPRPTSSSSRSSPRCSRAWAARSGRRCGRASSCCRSSRGRRPTRSSRRSVTTRSCAAMPNTPARIGNGMTVWYATPATTADQRDQARALLGALGAELEVEDEKWVAMATAVSGTGPAYVFLVMEALDRRRGPPRVPAPHRARPRDRDARGQHPLREAVGRPPGGAAQHGHLARRDAAPPRSTSWSRAACARSCPRPSSPPTAGRSSWATRWRPRSRPRPRRRDDAASTRTPTADCARPGVGRG